MSVWDKYSLLNAWKFCWRLILAQRSLFAAQRSLFACLLNAPSLLACSTLLVCLLAQRSLFAAHTRDANEQMSKNKCHQKAPCLLLTQVTQCQRTNVTKRQAAARKHRCKQAIHIHNQLTNQPNNIRRHRHIKVDSVQFFFTTPHM